MNDITLKEIKEVSTATLLKKYEQAMLFTKEDPAFLIVLNEIREEVCLRLVRGGQMPLNDIRNILTEA